MRSPLAMIGAIVLGIISILVGVWYQLHPHNHTVSYHSLAFWGLALVLFVGASFARPQRV